MRFYEIVARGRQPSGLVLNTFWYRDVAAGVPNADSLSDATRLFRDYVIPKYAAIMPSQWTLEELNVYGYDESWNRQPFLPLITPINQAGGILVADIEPYMAIVYSCRVEPMQPSAKVAASGAVELKPVRRGYLSIGPVFHNWINTDGQVDAAGYRTAATYVAFANQVKTNLFDASVITPLEPIRVGKPGKGQTQKGYGLVKDCVIRGYGSTRRSRMYQKGA